jgi:hypothetical protein
VARETPDAVAERIADDAAEHSGQKDFQKTVGAEKIAVRHDAREQQGNVALDRAESENRVNAPGFDDLRNLFHRLSLILHGTRRTGKRVTFRTARSQTFLIPGLLNFFMPRLLIFARPAYFLITKK